jgi:predicted DNA-binding transcriptional regulator YafY
VSPRSAVLPDDAAEAILSRLLVTLPLAAALPEEGVGIRSLARDLGVDPRRLLQDFTEVHDRGYYLRAGLGDQVSVAMDAERIRVWTTGEFRRPVRLTTAEALALELGMRMVERDEATRQLSAHLLAALGARDSEAWADAPPGTIGVPAPDPLEDPVVAEVEEALRRGDVLRLAYRPAGREVEVRHLLPGLLAHAEGSWYVVGRDLDREAPRIFRCDRILEAERRDPHGFDPPAAPLTDGERARFHGFLGEGRVFMDPVPGVGAGQGDPPVREVRVRYDAEIVPWIREHGYDRVEEGPGGSLVVTHRVQGDAWLVRHVMYYAGSAEVLTPSDLRSRVARLASALVDPGG